MLCNVTSSSSKIVKEMCFPPLTNSAFAILRLKYFFSELCTTTICAVQDLLVHIYWQGPIAFLSGPVSRQLFHPINRAWNCVKLLIDQLLIATSLYCELCLRYQRLVVERHVLAAVEVLYQCFGEILSWTILHTVDIFSLQNQSNGASFVCEDCFKFLKCLIINLNGFCTSFKGHTTCNVYFATRCVVLNDVIDCHQCCQVFIRVYLLKSRSVTTGSVIFVRLLMWTSSSSVNLFVFMA